MFGFPSDAEQVQSILSEVPLNPTFWCRIRFHVWTRWTVVHTGKAPNWKGLTNVPYEEVRRECKCCGYPQKKIRFAEMK